MVYFNMSTIFLYQRNRFGLMAATPKGPQKAKLDFNVDRGTYDQFIRNCASKGYAPQTVMERLMKKFIETGQM